MLLKLKQQKLIDGQHVEPLMQKYYCDVPCPNRRNYCYVVDGIHLKILPQQMQAWSISINDDLASLENPPEVQLRSFQPVKSNQVNPFRNTQKNCTNHSTQVPSTPEPHPTPQIPLIQQAAGLPHTSSPFPSSQYHPGLYHGIPPPSYFYPPYASGFPLMPLADSHREKEVQASEPQTEPPSSSFKSDTDGTDKLIAYITWLGSKAPKLEAKFKTACEILLERDFTFGDLSKLPEDRYIRLGISEGIAYQIKSNTGAYNKKKAKGLI